MVTRAQRLEAATGYSEHSLRRIAAYAGRALGELTDAEVLDLVSVYLTACEEIERERQRRARRPVLYRYDARGRVRALGGAR